MAAQTTDDAIDRLLGGRYRLVAIIGQGGMSAVYRAHDESLDRDVAVKLFHQHALDSDRQEGELAVLAALNHHGVIDLYDAGVTADSLGRAQRFMVMALVAGSNLHQRIAAGPIAARHIAEIGYDMAEALEYIHARNVVHRDIKPSNILLVDYGDGAQRARARLTDFGIALTDDVDRLTADNQTTGTAAYLSPEQAAGDQVGFASDVYSLGLALLECFTRSVEFGGTLVESAMARLVRDPRIPESLSEHWATLFRAMTARNPDDRPAGGELVALLRQIVIAESARHKDVGSSVFVVGSAEHLSADVALLDTFQNQALDRATSLAARLFDAPISVVTALDRDRTWASSFVGPSAAEWTIPAHLHPTAETITEPLIIEDGSVDERTRETPLFSGASAVRFYAGVPLLRHDGEAIGTLCVLDLKPNRATEDQIASLIDLAALLMAQLESRGEGLRITGQLSGTLPTPVPATRSGMGIHATREHSH